MTLAIHQQTPPQSVPALRATSRRPAHYLLLLLAIYFFCGGLFLLYAKACAIVAVHLLVLPALVPGLFISISGAGAFMGWYKRVSAPFTLFFGILLVQPVLPSPRSSPQPTALDVRLLFFAVGAGLIAWSIVQDIRRGRQFSNPIPPPTSDNAA
jgi:hypothetical protein